MGEFDVDRCGDLGSVVNPDFRRFLAEESLDHEYREKSSASPDMTGARGVLRTISVALSLHQTTLEHVD